MNLESVQHVIDQYIVGDDPCLLPTLLSAVVANRLPGDPVWLLLIGSSSTGKTELLECFRGLHDTFFLSDLTPRTLVSGYRQADGANASLLPKLLKKCVLMKDFTTVLSMPQEKRAEILGQLREIYDGNYDKFYGNALEVKFEGKVGFMAGVTQAIDLLYHRVHSILGERFVYLRHDLVTDALREQSARVAALTNADHARFRTTARDTVARFLEGLPASDPVIPPEISESLIHISEAVTWGRCPVSRDGYTRHVQLAPSPEGPGRIMKQLSTMARASAALYRKKAVDQQALSLVRRVAHDSIPPMRLRILRQIQAHEGTEIKGVSERLRLPYSTVREHAEDLEIIRLIDVKDDGRILSERGRMILQQIGVSYATKDHQTKGPQPVAGVRRHRRKGRAPRRATR